MSDIALKAHAKVVQGDLEQVPIATSTNGDTILVAGSDGTKIIVYSIFIMAAGAVSVTWKSDQNVIIGASAVAANGGYHLTSPFGVVQTNDGEDLILNLGGSVSVGGVVNYDVIQA